MKILLVGGGGREHALAWKLTNDSRKPVLFCAPGNAGTARLGSNLSIEAEDIPGLSKWAIREKPDLTVVGPEAPLCAGLVDELQAHGLRVFGPCKAAARIEGSKIFAKDVLREAGVPTGHSECFREAASALTYIESTDFPVVIKADGLASGKGVFICYNRDHAKTAIETAMVQRSFGAAGCTILMEEHLEGEEISMMALVDGNSAVLLPSAQDHKRVQDGNRGPNTGGMGAYSPSHIDTTQFRNTVMKDIFVPTLSELRRRGIRYHGVLYAGLIITKDGPKVLEFNCRFGDPETQVVLPRIDGDLIPAMEACIDGKLNSEYALSRHEHCVCVVMTAGGYPGAYRTGDIINGLRDVNGIKDVTVFHAGTRMDHENVVTSGGRVLGVTALGADTAKAAAMAYKAVSAISFKDAYYRRDIASSVRDGRP